MHPIVRAPLKIFLDLLTIGSNLGWDCIKDSTQLIRELRDLPVTEKVILATIDVKSLYTCIPHEDGLLACREAFENFKADNPEQPDTDELIQLLEVVFEK